ncbi:MAG: aminoacyl-tRNA hydrolase [Desulfobacterales bacterium]|jgi:PTH1 family peptidyl-tRNA hydrolase|nr:aminoacyl-tRNA hydrolase [Desulfobacterales bacterium]
MQNETLRLVAGLGNPGKDYENTRHNIGFTVIDHMARLFDIQLSTKKFDTIFGRGSIQGVPVILAKPQSFMNRSGRPLRQLAGYYRIPSREMLILHDDIDLAFERLKIKEKGGDGGHRGIRSIIEAFGGGEFTRVRIGVGRGTRAREDGADVAGHVLSRFNRSEARMLDRIIERSAEAVVMVLCQGVTVGMNRYNTKTNDVQL